MFNLSNFLGSLHIRQPFFGDSLGVRTRDPNIKSVVLYQLS